MQERRDNLTILDAEAELLAALSRLEGLNPDLGIEERKRLLQLADFCAKRQDGALLDTVEERVTRLADLCAGSDVKRAGRNIMREYFDRLEEGAKRLAAAGEISPYVARNTDASNPNGGAGTPQSGAFTQALVPRSGESARDLCRVMNRTDVPRDLQRAATAYLRRNGTVASVLEEGLRLFWHLSASRAMAWEIRYFESHKGQLDPENVRDLLKIALEGTELYPAEYLKWARCFAADMNLVEYWPKVSRYADQVLHREGLQRWERETKARNPLLTQLRFYIGHQLWNEDKLLAWARHALTDVGNAVARFIDLEQSNLDEKWRSATLSIELHRIAEIYRPVMLLADTLLVLPDGAEQFAMALMGLAGEGRNQWEQHLEEFSRRAVRRSFLMAVKAHQSPVETIRKLTFGDSVALRAAMAELDLGSQQFESQEQREKVVRILGVYYASYRREKLLDRELTRRYHRLMRMIHEDFLSTALPAGQLAEFQQSGILTDLSTLLAEARKFLQQRRIQENTLEELLAARIQFDRFVRQKRLLLCGGC